ncbi:MAG: Do family serine endopeptidase [Porticoccaceae bacterium]
MFDVLSRYLLLTIAVLFSSSALSVDLPDFTDLIKQTSPAVVKINTFNDAPVSESGVDPSIPPYFREFFERYSQPRQRPQAGVGSGFIISEDGYVVTNHHVVNDATRIVVRLDDRREYEAVVVGTDERSDLALLKIDEEDLPVLEFADSATLDVGDWVIAIGSPFDLDYSASAGIVSAIGRSLPNNRGQDYVPFIQTDVAINPGNSGGPLFNMDGKVVGINSQIFTRSGGYMGLSFAVPSSVATEVIAQLMDSGQVSRGWLGVVIQDVDLNLARSFGLDKPQGALVTRVQRGGPADRAGIRSGDVILEFDGKPIDYSHDLPHVVGLVAPGSRVEARLIREMREEEITVEVGELDQSGQTRLASAAPDDEPQGLGLVIEEANRSTLEQLEINAGVVVGSVEVGSAAAKAGLLAGDILVQIAFEQIDSPERFDEIVADLEPGSVVPILFYRGDTAIFRTIRVDG